MKKWTYLLSGILIGAIVATSGSAAAAQIKSMIGQKVTGELKVVVNGKELPSKGAVINGVTNAPVRALSDALGANLQLEGKVITITTNDATGQSGSGSLAGSASSENPYVGQPKASLEKIKNGLENDTLKVLRSERDEILSEIDLLKTIGEGGTSAPGLEAKEKQLEQYDSDIAKYTKQLEQVNAALQAFEK